MMIKVVHIDELIKKNDSILWNISLKNIISKSHLFDQ